MRAYVSKIEILTALEKSYTIVAAYTHFPDVFITFHLSEAKGWMTWIFKQQGQFSIYAALSRRRKLLIHVLPSAIRVPLSVFIVRCWN